MDLEDTMLRVASQLEKFKLSNFIQMWKIKMISELEKQRKLLDYKIKKERLVVTKYQKVQKCHYMVAGG